MYWASQYHDKTVEFVGCDEFLPIRSRANVGVHHYVGVKTKKITIPGVLIIVVIFFVVT